MLIIVKSYFSTKKKKKKNQSADRNCFNEKIKAYLLSAVSSSGSATMPTV